MDRPPWDSDPGSFTVAAADANAVLKVEGTSLLLPAQRGKSAFQHTKDGNCMLYMGFPLFYSCWVLQPKILSSFM